MNSELDPTGLSTSIKSNDGSADDKRNDGYVFREREVDAKKNPTKLFRLIMLRQFKTATERLQYNADEASIWIYVRNKKKHSRKKYTARQLPIHIACILLKPNMPNLLKLIKKLIEVYPDGLKKPDIGGQLPIHIAVWKAAPLPIIVKMLRLNPTSLEQQSDEKGKPLEYDPHSGIKRQISERTKILREKKEKEKSNETPPQRTTGGPNLTSYHFASMRKIDGKRYDNDQMSINSNNSWIGSYDSEIDELQTKLEDVSRKLMTETWKNNALLKKISDVTENRRFQKSRPESEILEENEKLRAEINRIRHMTSRLSLSSKQDDKKEMKDESKAMINEDDDKINDDMIMSIENESHSPPKQDIDTSRQTSIDNSNDKLEEAFDNNNNSSGIQHDTIELNDLSNDYDTYDHDAYMQCFSEFENAMYALTDEEKYEQIINLDKTNRALKRLIGSYNKWIEYIEMEMVDPQPMWQRGIDKELSAEVMNELRQLMGGQSTLKKPVQLHISCAAYDDTFEVDEYWD